MTSRASLAVLLLAGCASVAPAGGGGCPSSTSSSAASSSGSGGAPMCGTLKPSPCVPSCDDGVGWPPGADDTPFGCGAGDFIEQCATTHGDLGSRCRPTKVLGEACCWGKQCDSGHCSAQGNPGVCSPPVDAGCFPGCPPDGGT